jgi:uncharacterized damage-inducible protein DinB
MFTRDLLLELYRHMEWADARVWAAAPTSDPADVRLRSLLVHMHTVQRAFLAVWTGRPLADAIRGPDTAATLAEVRAWARPVYADLIGYLGTRDASRLGETFSPPWAADVQTALGRVPGPTTIGETCFQVANHTTHHRGQVNARLRELGLDPPHVDYIVWLWLERPAPVWSA